MRTNLSLPVDGAQFDMKSTFEMVNVGCIYAATVALSIDPPFAPASLVFHLAIPSGLLHKCSDIKNQVYFRFNVVFFRGNAVVASTHTIYDLFVIAIHGIKSRLTSTDLVLKVSQPIGFVLFVTVLFTPV